MPITQDAFGNTFLGNYLLADSYTTSDFLDFLRTALGSNDRANSTTNSRFDWRPNIVEETLSGAIPTPPNGTITTSTANGYTLAANSRMAFQLNGSFLLASGQSNVVPPYGTGSGGFLGGGSSVLAVGTSRNFAAFIKNTGEPTRNYFVSQGVFLNSPLSYPNNRYHITSITDGTPSAGVRSRSYDGVATISMFASGAIANYAHTKLSDGQPTTNEVELYLRRQLDDNHLGFVPNVFKVKIEPPNTSVLIGDIVRLNMADAQSGSFYFGQGTIFCVVAGRLGNTSETDLTGDYLFMRIAG